MVDHFLNGLSPLIFFLFSIGGLFIFEGFPYE